MQAWEPPLSLAQGFSIILVKKVYYKRHNRQPMLVPKILSH